MNRQPPKLASDILLWFLREELAEEVLGDLEEKYHDMESRGPIWKAKINFWFQVLNYLRPFALKHIHSRTIYPIMLRHYLLINWRNLLKNKGYSMINIGGLGLGIAIAMIISLWIYDELTYNTYHPDHEGIGWVLQNRIYGEEKTTWFNVPHPTAEVLRSSYGNYFQTVVSSTWIWEYSLKVEEEIFLDDGAFMDASAPQLLGLELLEGSSEALSDVSSVLIAKSLATKLFGLDSPMGKRIQIGDNVKVQVAGVYKDIPSNSHFKDLKFIASWDKFIATNAWVQSMTNPWENNSFPVYVKLAKGENFEKASTAIEDLLVKKLTEAGDEASLSLEPSMFIHPMDRWHLYNEFKDGVNTGGRISYVWLFGIISLFVLLLACINFMNLSTARSEKRAREVGIRKAIGSQKYQLIQQFFSESFLVALLGYMLALGIIAVSLPWFNQIANKDILFPYDKPGFWLAGLGFTLLTGLLAGSYPAFYLSSFESLQALKGSLKNGKSSSLPRKILVVVQFTVSIALIIGTTIVYNQIYFGQNRAVGYEQAGLVFTPILNDEVANNISILEQELLKNGAIESLAVTQNPITEIWSTSSGLSWKGKDPNMREEVSIMYVSATFGETINWEVNDGRDFSTDFSSDSTAFILNQAAVDLMQLETPVGEVIEAWGEKLSVVGVVDNMIMKSPFSSAQPTLFRIINFRGNHIHFKLAAEKPASESLALIEESWAGICPGIPFTYEFVDKAYAKKFNSEQRIMKLAGIFAALAIFISCLGLFALAAFMAEKRTKEIGIRKILGASVSNIWKILSADFVILVSISCFIAVPASFFYLKGWLNTFEYSASISAWVYIGACIAALGLAILTVSIQTLKAATSDPVNALRYE
ncbi:MAG: FtsX-like permease family protein [Bacteroidota bacterium]